ncbi:MAG: hypothetical protein NVSMB47_11230 [Polyangiales bacterium]
MPHHTASNPARSVHSNPPMTRTPIDPDVLHVLDRSRGSLIPAPAGPPPGCRVVDRMTVCRAIREAGGHLRDAAHALGLGPEHLVLILEHDLRVAVKMITSGVRPAVTAADIEAFERQERLSDGDLPAWEEEQRSSEAACGGRKRR